MTGDEVRNWKDYLGYTDPKFVISPVVGQDQNFYPVSVKLLSRLRTAAKPIIQGVSILFGANVEDQTRIDRGITSDQSIKAIDKDGEPIELTGQDTETIVDAIDPVLAKMRHDQKQEAIEQMFEGLTSDNNLVVVADIIMDSMRDVFTKENGKPKPDEFIEQTPVPHMIHMIQGVIKANADVVGPFAEKLKAAAEAAMGRATAKLENVAAETEPNENESKPPAETTKE